MYLLPFEVILVWELLLTGLKWLRNNLSTKLLTSTSQRGKSYEKKLFTFDFHMFYLNTDASVVKFFPGVVFQ